MTGSQLFAAYIESECGTRLAAAYQLKVAVSTVHYWLTTSAPRAKHRKKLERWSKGRIPAELPWREPKAQAAA